MALLDEHLPVDKTSSIADNEADSQPPPDAESQSTVPTVQDQPKPTVEPINICPKPDLENDSTKSNKLATPDSATNVMSPPGSSPGSGSAATRAGRRKRKAAPKKVGK